MLDGSGLPILKTKYTAKEREIFDKILNSAESETLDLMAQLSNLEIPRFEEYQSDVIAVEAYQQRHTAQAAAYEQQAQTERAKGNAALNQYAAHKAQGGKLKQQLNGHKQEEARILKKMERPKPRKGGCVIL